MIFDTFVKGNIEFENKLFDCFYLKKRTNELINIIANKVDINAGVVAIAMPRSIDLVLTICAMLELKITFLPIDISQPLDRLNYMIENAGVQFLITDSERAVKDLHVKNVVNIYDNIKIVECEAEVRNNNVAYVLYTSGTTGRPKAVEVTRKGFINFLDAVPEIICFEKGQRIACFTSFTFDIFFLESILALFRGLTVVLANESERNNPRLMSRLIVENNVDILQITPSGMKVLLLYDEQLICLNSLKTIMIGGETFPNSLLKELQNKTSANIYNMYGPTETTIWSAISDLTDKKAVDIGRPIRNTRIYILDEQLQFVKKGMIGEICISGDGLALGYINEPEKNKENFKELDWKHGEKIYRTGDLGRYNENGDLECLGRKDNQIKMRGHRIELEEIDSNFEEIDGIKLGVTCYQKNESGGELIIFYVAEDNLQHEYFTDKLSKLLPDFMIPQKYVRVDKFVYTSSGKIDRDAMLNLINRGTERNNRFDDNATGDENTAQKINEVIRELTKKPEIYISSEKKLLELGINSLNFVSIILELEDIFDIEFEDNKLSYKNYETIRDIENYVNYLLN